VVVSVLGKTFFSVVVPCHLLNGWTVCRFHGARGSAPEGKRNGNYRHLARTKATIELWRFIKSLS